MTRWARGGPSNKKKPNEATSWADMTTHSKHPDSHTKNVKNKTTKPISKNKSGKPITKNKTKSSSVVDILTEKSKGSDRWDAEPVVGLAEELEKMKKTAEELSDEEERSELRGMIRKEERREGRRLKRIDQRQNDKICFRCRESGHDMTSCPKVKDKVDGGGICFKCGSMEHTMNKCRRKLPPGEYPFATCFICSQTGHLSSQCTENPRGLYPKGGGCRECGSVEHFKRDCPDLQRKKGVPEIKLTRSLGAFSNVEELPPEQVEVEQPTVTQKHKPKVVLF